MSDLVKSNLVAQLSGRTSLYGPQHSNNGGLIKPVFVQSNLWLGPYVELHGTTISNQTTEGSLSPTLYSKTFVKDVLYN